MSANDQELTEADKIRLKRLARLGGPSAIAQPNQESGSSDQLAPASPAPRAPASAISRLLSSAYSSSASATTPDGSSPTSSSSAVTTTETTNTPVKPKRSTPTPSSGLGLGSNTTGTSAGVSTSTLSLQKKPLPSPSATPAHSTTVPARATPVAVPSMSYEDWEVGKIGTIFSVALDRAAASDWKLCWLKGLSNELKEENPDAPLKTTFELRNEILVARLSLDAEALSASDDPDQLQVLAGLPQDETVFEYLTGCWKRLYQANRELRALGYSPEEKTRWAHSFEELKRLIISYCGMTLEDPSMFPQPAGRPVGPAEFLPLLLAVTSEAPSSSGDPLTSSTPTPAPVLKGALAPTDLLPFLNDLATGFPDDTMGDVISPTLSLFFQEWFKISPTPDLMGNEWRRYLGAMALLVQVKTIAGLLPSLPVWVAPGVDAPKIEWQSLLGPLTRLSVYPREFIWKTYFSNPTERKTADIDANKANLRHTMGGLQTSLFNIYNSIVRASPESREKVLEFFALVAKLNVRRQGTHVSFKRLEKKLTTNQVDIRTVSSDGFMTNLHVILLKLFEPVMDVQFSKIDKVDPEYYRISKRIDITDETKIRGTKEEADQYFTGAMDTDSKPNFISELFFLLNSFQHLGIVKTIGTRVKAERNISDIEKQLRHHEAQRAQWAGNPATETQGEAAIKKLKNDIAVLHASIHAYDTQLLDPGFTRLNVTFCGFLMTWLVRLVDPTHRHPQTSISLPLPDEAPLRFRMLPEYLIENITEYFDFLARYEPDALDNADKDVLITFTITFLCPGYVNNPFLKAKLVSALSNGLYPVGYHRKGPLFDRLSLHPLSTEFLMPTLIRFFIDVEMTGGHTQFWDKFNFRRDISRIFKAMWENPLHREAFVKSRHDNFDQFIKFTNMLMSDTTFHLEESLTNLTKIHSIRSQQANTESWQALPQAEREDLESQMRQAETSAPFHTQMGLDHVELIRDFTKTTKEPFLTGEIVDRLAASLDENLVNLVGPKMQELKLSDPDRFSFKPKRLLAAIAQIYLNLGEEPDFIRAVANDGRSYTRELFERFARILKHRAIMTESEVTEVVNFIQRVEDMKATIVIEDEREIPDEFLDPLLATLMKDPVILPMSRVTIDRSTIRAVLLSKELDPFNNMPLKFEDCIPNTELKAKIDAWIAEGKNGKAEEVMDVDQL